MLLVDCVLLVVLVVAVGVCRLFNSVWVFRVGLLGFACFGFVVCWCLLCVYLVVFGYVVGLVALL